MRSLPDDFWHHDEREQTLTGRRTRLSFRLAQEVEVRLAEASPVTGGLVFHILQGGARRALARQPASRGNGLGQVIRIGALLLLLLIATRACPTYPLLPAASTRCWSPTFTPTALAFMAPRTLEPVPVSAAYHLGPAGAHGAGSRPRHRTAGRQAQLGARDRVLLADRRPPAATSMAGPRRPRNCRTAGGGRFGSGAPRRHAGRRAKLLRRDVQPSRSRIPATCRRARPARIASAARARPAPDCIWSGGMRCIAVAEAISDGPGAMPASAPAIRSSRSTASRRRARTRARWTTDRRAGRHPRGDRWRGRDGRAHTADLERAHGAAGDGLRQRIGDMLVLAVTGFNRSTDSHLAARDRSRALRRQHPAAGIVLDLRGNRGGLLRAGGDGGGYAAARRASSPSPPDATRTPTRIWRPMSGELAEDMPVVVMVDGRTASAAEILAAALADRGRGVVVGSSTLGKGLVQTDRSAARRRRVVRHLEPRACAARLADPGPGRAAAGLHQPWARTRSARNWLNLAQGRQPMAHGAGHPPRRPRAAAAGADTGDPQRLPRRRGPRR